MKCKACGGHGRVYPQLGPVYNGEQCPSCHGTGVEPVATGHSCAMSGGQGESCPIRDADRYASVLTCCYRDTCAEARHRSALECPEVALRSRLATVLAAGDALVLAIENDSGWSEELAEWKKVRDA